MIDPRIVELNHRHKQFWDRQYSEMNKRLDDDVVAQLAFRRQELELQLRPAYMQLPVEAELAVAEDLSKLHRRLVAKDAVSKRPSDALSKFIESAVAKKIDLTELELVSALINAANPAGPVISVGEDEIEYLTGAGKVGYAHRSGLKDRLSRAKAKVRKK